MYQPIQQALHTQTLDREVARQGVLIQQFVKTVQQLFQNLEKHTQKKIQCSPLYAIPLDEPRQTYAYIRSHEKDLYWIWSTVAEMEMYWRLSQCKDLCFVEYKHTKTPFLHIEDFVDPSITTTNPILSSCRFNMTSHHAILTGPNQGGKSSSLRAICLNVWLAQTIGMAFAKKMTLTPFTWIRSGLRLADTPGSKSLFEREIVFATKTLQLAKGKSGLGLVLYDECFHSTNPPDAEQTSRLFLQTLWKSQTTLSLVSTHVFSLVEQSPSHIQRLCVPAKKTESGMEYSFQLSPGICKVSSVEEIYKKYGFPSADK
jgi:DNA mismatch repair ATPase MutS